MESLELANEIAQIAVDRLGEDILILDISEVTTFTDYFVICTANSRRQLDALQAAVREELKQIEDVPLPISIEGDSDGGWILLDYNGVIVHLFNPEMRAYYQLEDLWKNGRVVARIQ